jgi:hypothetical protein
MEVCQESQHDFSFLCMIFVYLTLLFLGLSLLLTSQVMDRAINQQALSPLIMAYPRLPFSRIVASLMEVQYFDSIGFLEILGTIVLFFKGFSTELILVLVSLWLLTYADYRTPSLTRWMRMNYLFVFALLSIFAALFVGTGYVAYQVFYRIVGSIYDWLEILSSYYYYSGVITVILIVIFASISIYVFHQRPKIQ